MGGMSGIRWGALALCAMTAGLGCGDGGGGVVPSGDAGCVGCDGGGDGGSERTLADTGLYSDPASETLADGVRPYTPQFELWSDTASKRRWVYIPGDATIDTSDMDAWLMPVGTKLWKEFSRDGVRVETRLIERTEGFWEMSTFVWNEDQSEAVELEGFAGIDDANGTDHDVPGPDGCNQCHRRVEHVVLGFSAVQLDYAPDDDTHLNLEDLVTEGLLSDPPAGGGVPYNGVPGDPSDRAALGYLHGNCGNCHNDLGSGVLDGEIDFLIPWGVTDVNDLGALDDGSGGDGGNPGVIGVSANKGPVLGADLRIDPGDHESSQVWTRMKQQVRGTQNQMPQLGSEDEDTAAAQVIADWIDGL